MAARVEPERSIPASSVWIPSRSGPADSATGVPAATSLCSDRLALRQARTPKWGGRSRTCGQPSACFPCVCSDQDAGEMHAYEVAVPGTTKAGQRRSRWLEPLEASAGPGSGLPGVLHYQER
jgi:hypothetical protein